MAKMDWKQQDTNPKPLSDIDLLKQEIEDLKKRIDILENK